MQPTKLEAETKPRTEVTSLNAEQKAKLQAFIDAIPDSEAKLKAKAEAEAIAEAEAKAIAEAEAEAKAKAEAEAKALAEAEALAKAVAEEKAKAEAEEKAKIEAEATALEKARIEALLAVKLVANSQPFFSNLAYTSHFTYLPLFSIILIFFLTRLHVFYNFIIL